MTIDVERRLERLEDRAQPPSDAESRARWDEFTAGLLAVPTGGILPAHLEEPEQRDEAMAVLLAEQGIDPDKMGGDELFEALVRVLDAVASNKAKLA